MEVLQKLHIRVVITVEKTHECVISAFVCHAIKLLECTVRNENGSDQMCLTVLHTYW